MLVMQVSFSFGFLRLVRNFLLLLATPGVLYIAWKLLTQEYPLYALSGTGGVAAVWVLFVMIVTAPRADTAKIVQQAVELHATKELYTALYEQSPVPYLTINREGNIITANTAAGRLFAIHPEKLVGVSFQNFVRHEDADALAMISSKLSAGIALSDTELQVATYGNETRWVALSVFVNESFHQRLVSLVDITHHKMVDKAKSEFVALATHQLRTPIAAIRWNVELLERSMRGTANEKQATYLEKVERNIMRMIALINDFLSVSKLETGTFSTAPEQIHVREYLDTIVDEYQQAVTEKQITLTTNYQPADLIMSVDTRLFHIVTSNLLSNATKYTPNGGTIQFGYVVSGDHVTFTVADSGIGIPAHEQEQLFTKFFRATNAQTHRAEGTGLGLYIVQQSVEKLGGTIEYTSVENEGTTFMVRLPIVA